MNETLESTLAELLDKYSIPYKQEGVQIRYGGKAGKGKFDFETPTHVIECKQKDELRKLTLPGMNKRTNREILYPHVHGHQIRALRESRKVGGLLIHITSTNLFYWVNMDVYEDIIIKHRPRTLNKLIDNCIIDLEDFVKEELK
jgi:hypothetical protein